jgi:hypothetical protein
VESHHLRCCCSAGKDLLWFKGAGERWLDFLLSLTSEPDKFDRKLELPEGFSPPLPCGEKDAALTFIVAGVFLENVVPCKGQPSVLCIGCCCCRSG